MVDGSGEGRDGAVQELIMRMVATHAASLLRTARRHSLCADDAQDAYQRTLELFLAHADRLDPGRAPGWLHVVVKREAIAIRNARVKLVSSSDVNLDDVEGRCDPTPEDQLLTIDAMSRSAEALQRLKPNELRALWLKAQGHTYNDISAATGWSYTKVNRCLTEGRRSFLRRYADIESGLECERWLPVISAMVDGEATTEQIVELRAHLRNCMMCRASLRALRESTEPLAALLPAPALAGGAASSTDAVTDGALRVAESFLGDLSDRAARAVVRVQMLADASASKLTALVQSPLGAARPGATAAAVAGCLAVGSGATVCVTESINPISAVSDVVTSAKHERPKPKPATRYKRTQEPQPATPTPIVSPTPPAATAPAPAPPPPPAPVPPPPPPPPPVAVAEEEYEPGDPTAAAAATPPPPPPPQAASPPRTSKSSPSAASDEFGGP